MIQNSTDIVTVKELSKTFDGVHALSDVGFSVKRGQIKALIGPNGAGKSTMLNVMSGLLPPDTGHIYFGGHDVARWNADKIAYLGLSRTFQIIRLFTVNEATVMDNLMVAAHKQLKPSLYGALFFRKALSQRIEEAREKAFSLLDFLGLGGLEDDLPSTLPFGSQRLVELARALMTDPQLLLLDEPASGLNDAEVESFMNVLLKIRQMGITILLVEHNMRVVMNLADDIVVLNFGRKLAQGSPSDISSNPDVIEAYLGSQS